MINLNIPLFIHIFSTSFPSFLIESLTDFSSAKFFLLYSDIALSFFSTSVNGSCTLSSLFVAFIKLIDKYKCQITKGIYKAKNIPIINLGFSMPLKNALFYIPTTIKYIANPIIKNNANIPIIKRVIA